MPLTPQWIVSKGLGGAWDLLEIAGASATTGRGIAQPPPRGVSHASPSPRSWGVQMRIHGCAILCRA